MFININNKQQFQPLTKLNIQMKKETDSTNDRTGQVKTSHNNHLAMKKLKDAQEHVEMMKRRFKVLQVKDDQCRSKTIQHYNKLKFHEEVHKTIVRDKQEQKKIEQMRLYEIDLYKDKNKKMKNLIEEKVKEAKETVQAEKVQDNKKGRENHIKNEEIYSKIKNDDFNHKQNRRKKLNEQEEIKKMKISRYFESRVKETIDNKSLDVDRILTKAGQQEKELEKLSKIEQEMVKRNSESIQVSQEMKNKLRQVLGDERRFTRLPHLRSRTTQFTGSSNNSTQLVMI